MPIRIRSKRDGFRRCGKAHSSQWTEWPDDAWTAEELERLRAEPMLQVEVVAPAEDPGKPDKNAKKK